MLRPGWTDTLLRTALLLVGAGALAACSSFGSSSAERASTVPTREAPSPELEARNHGVEARVEHRGNLARPPAADVRLVAREAQVHVFHR